MFSCNNLDAFSDYYHNNNFFEVGVVVFKTSKFQPKGYDKGFVFYSLTADKKCFDLSKATELRFITTCKATNTGGLF